MFPLTPAQLEDRRICTARPVRTRYRVVGVRMTRHLLITHNGVRALMCFKNVEDVPYWLAQVADDVVFLNPEQVAECPCPTGEFVYDELLEDGELTMRVVCGIRAENGFVLRRPMVHVDADMTGHDIVWKPGLPSDA